MLTAMYIFIAETFAAEDEDCEDSTGRTVSIVCLALILLEIMAYITITMKFREQRREIERLRNINFTYRLAAVGHHLYDNIYPTKEVLRNFYATPSSFTRNQR